MDAQTMNFYDSQAATVAECFSAYRRGRRGPVRFYSPDAGAGGAQRDEMAPAFLGASTIVVSILFPIVVDRHSSRQRRNPLLNPFFNGTLTPPAYSLIGFRSNRQIHFHC